MSRLLLLLLLSTHFALGTWSSPIALPINPETSNIAGGIDPLSGNLEFIWLDTNSNQYLSSTYLYPDSNWSTPQVVVSATNITINPQAAINAAGTAIALWVTNNNTLLAAIDTPAGWVSLGTVATATGIASFDQQPAIAIDQQGNIVATFSQDNGDSTATVFVARYLSGGWLVTPLGSDFGPISNNGTPTIALDLAGNGIIAWATNDGTNVGVYAANYLKSSLTVPVTQLFFAPTGQVNLAMAISPSGLGLVDWEIKPQGIYASIFNGSWSNPTLIPNSLGDISSNNGPPSSITNSGLASLVFNFKSTPQSVQFSTFNGSSWSTSTVISSPTDQYGVPLGAIDIFGNGLAIWLVQTPSSTTLYSSSRNGLNGTWSTPEFIGSASTPFITYPLVLNLLPSENAEFVYGLIDDVTFEISELNLTFGTNLFQLFPPTQLEGRTILNRFLLQSIQMNYLSWQASSDPSAALYLVYRNGQLIGQTSNTYFEDPQTQHPSVYTLIATNFNQTILSPPLTVTVP